MLVGMEVTREELERLIAEALLRERTFRPKRRDWNAPNEQDERRARITAAAVVTFLYSCGLQSLLTGGRDHRLPRERRGVTNFKQTILIEANRGPLIRVERRPAKAHNSHWQTLVDAFKPDECCFFSAYRAVFPVSLDH